MLQRLFAKRDTDNGNVQLGFDMLRGRLHQLFRGFTSAMVDIATRSDCPCRYSPRTLWLRTPSLSPRQLGKIYDHDCRREGRG